MTGPIDAPRAMRSGEELDREKLGAFLRAKGIEGDVTIEQFPGGHSNLTYLVRAGERELVLRRPPFGNRVKTAHDMGREYRILSRLSAAYPQAPHAILACDDDAVIGAPFYLMERVRGVVLRRALPKGLTLSKETARRLSSSFVDGLVALHAVDAKAVGLADLGKPEGYIERQVSGWTKRYRDAKTDEIDAMDRVAAWLAARVDEAQREVRAAVIHNDYKFDNLVLDADDLPTIRGVLDWEMSTLGDPLMDLGTALGYWVQEGDSDEIRGFAFGPTALPGMMTRAELAARYGAATGRDVSNMLFFFVFALFKTAGVAQQIYWRFHQGLTKDERFGAFIMGVRILAAEAERAIARGAI